MSVVKRASSIVLPEEKPSGLKCCMKFVQSKTILSQISTPNISIQSSARETGCSRSRLPDTQVACVSRAVFGQFEV